MGFFLLRVFQNWTCNPALFPNWMEGCRRENSHQIYVWAKYNYGKAAVPKWNFHKILINKEGKIHSSYSSFINPTSKKITSEIEKILNIK